MLGNVLANDAAGADGVTLIRTVSHNGVTYTLVGDGSGITATSGTDGVDFTFDTTTGELTILSTQQGGTFSIDMAGTDAGGFEYESPNREIIAPIFDTFEYRAEDTDGSLSNPASLQVQIDPNLAPNGDFRFGNFINWQVMGTGWVPKINCPVRRGRISASSRPIMIGT